MEVLGELDNFKRDNFVGVSALKSSQAFIHRPNIVEAVAMILEGAQTLLVPILSESCNQLHHHHNVAGAGELCWLTQEDMIRFFFNSIAFFSPTASGSVTQLGLVRSTDKILAVRHDDPAVSAVPLIQRALREQTSVAVVTDDHKLIGEISPSTLAGCHIAVAAALCALSAGDFIAYIDSSSSPTAAGNRAVKSILRRKGMQGMVEEDYTLVGVVLFRDILKLFQAQLQQNNLY